MFFSVKSPIRIAGKIFAPCICYEVKDMLVPTIEKLVTEGKARTYPERVFFQNGKVIEKKCEVCDNNLSNGVCLGNSKNEMTDTTGELKCFEKKGKKKEKTVPAVDTVEDIPSSEEIADEGL